MPTFNYRVVGVNDCPFDEVLELCTKAGLAINGSINEEAMYQTVQAFYTQGDVSERVMLLAYNEDTPVGILAGVRVFNHFLYGNDMCLEMVVWVDEEYRGSRILHRLVKAYEKWATVIGCTKIMMSDIHDNEKLRRMYEKKGYSKVETSFIKEVN